MIYIAPKSQKRIRARNNPVHKIFNHLSKINIQGCHQPGKPGRVREFDSGQGKWKKSRKMLFASLSCVTSIAMLTRAFTGLTIQRNKLMLSRTIISLFLASRKCSHVLSHSLTSTASLSVYSGHMTHA